MTTREEFEAFFRVQAEAFENDAEFIVPMVVELAPAPRLNSPKAYPLVCLPLEVPAVTKLSEAIRFIAPAATYSPIVISRVPHSWSCNPGRQYL